jgi:hypothetical protein
MILPLSLALEACASCKLLIMVRPERFELPTLWFEAKCSIQLSYGRGKTEKCYSQK